MSIDITNHLIPYTTVKQMIAVAYKTGFHAGIKWAEEGDNNERTIRPRQHDRTPTPTPA